MTQQRPGPGLVGSYVDKLKQRLLSMVYYLTADQSVLQLTEQGWQQRQSFSRLPVLVLSRGCYQEKWQSFAIRSASELRKVLKQSEQGKLSFHFISKLEQGQRKVLTIIPYAEFWPLCQKASFVLPASVLIAATCEPGLHQLQGPDKSWFLLKYPNGDWQSALATPVMKQADSALLLLGGHPETQCFSWSEAQLPLLLQQGLRKLKAEHWFSGWNGLQSAGKSLPWQLLLTSGTALAACYLLASSAYLVLTSEYRQHLLQQGGDEMTQLLSERQQLQQQQQLVAALKQQLTEPSARQQLWELVATLQFNEIEVQRLQWFGQDLQLTAEADDATKALQKILDLPFVASAQFSTPVRKAQKREVFTAVVELQPGTTEVAAEPTEQNAEASND